jgi:peptidoglycan/xylan/chitin deacetylase (PgdA/CDA1 family)
MGFRTIASFMLSRSPLPHLARRSHRHDLTILMLHGFASGVQQPFEAMEHKHLDAKKWEAFADWLSCRYRVIPLSEAVGCMEKNKPMPDHAMCLTMDDGFRSNYELAFPVLKKYQMPASIFLATEFVHDKKPIWVDRVSYSLVNAGHGHAELRRIKDELKKRQQDDIESAILGIERHHSFALPTSVEDPTLPPTQRSLDWDQIQTMHACGLVEFGSHTHSHRILGRCSRNVALMELQTSRKIIEERIGSRCDLFCYPNGTPGDFTAETEILVKEAGYRCSLTTVTGWNSLKSSPFGLRRFGVDNALTLQRFQLMVSGTMRLLENLKFRH